MRGVGRTAAWVGAAAVLAFTALPVLYTELT